MTSTASILVVSSSSRVTSLLQRLFADGSSVVLVGDIDGARASMSVNPPSLVVLDDPNGGAATLRRCALLAEESSVPVIVWADGLGEQERIAIGLFGDCHPLASGLSVDEVAGLIEQRVRMTSIADELASAPRARHSEIVVDALRRRAVVNGRPVDLTRTEIELLTALLSRGGDVWPRKELISAVWGPAWFGASNVLDTHILNLRNKLALAGARTRICTVWGVGYFVEEEQLADLAV